MSECLVLATAAADADPQTQSPSAQDVDLGGLLGDQRRLTDRQYEYRGHQFDCMGARSQIRQKRQRLVQMPRVLPCDLFGNPQMGVPELLREAGEIPNRSQVVRQLAYR